MAKYLDKIEMAGETLVVLAAALWMTRAGWVAVVCAIGAVMVCVARFGQSQGGGDLTLRRLYGLRRLGSVMLLLSAALMFVRGTMYLGHEVYLFPSSWLIFFVVFAVIEVYTTIRILHIAK